MPIDRTYKKKFINSICFISILSLFFCTNPALTVYAVKKHKQQHKKGVEYSMTVAAIRPVNNDETYITIIFNESARFYKLPKNANPAYLDLLKESEKNKTRVLVGRVREESDVILSVKKQ